MLTRLPSCSLPTLCLECLDSPTRHWSESATRLASGHESVYCHGITVAKLPLTALRSVWTFAEEVKVTHSSMLTVTKWYLLPLLFAAVFAYRCWYDRLYDRGFGLLYNELEHQREFMLAQVLFGVVGIGGFVLLETFRKELPSWFRVPYVLLVASMVAFFVVDWIIIWFGPEPWWHHP